MVADFRAAVINGNFHQDIVHVTFCVFNETIKISVIFKYACIEQFILRALGGLFCSAAPIPGKEMLPADICKETCNTNEWVRNQDENKALSHLRHDCLLHWSIQKAFLLRMESLPFQNAGARHKIWSLSQKPPIPSSPQR